MPPETARAVVSYAADSRMPLRLRVIPPASRSGATGTPVTGTPATPERVVDFDDGVGQIRIGRRADLELTLPFAPLSGVHARLVRSAESTDWLLEDLGSTNGTFVGGERLKPGDKHPIAAGTQIKLAEIKVIFDGEVKRDEKNDATRVMPSAEPPVRRAAEGAEPPVKNTMKSTVPSAEPAAAKSADAARAPEMQAMAVELQARVAEMKARAPEPPPVTSASAMPSAEPPPVRSPAPPVKSAASPVKSVAPAVKSEAKGVEPTRTETFVRRPTPELSAPTPAPAAVPYLTAVEGIKDDVKTFRLEQREHTYMFGRTKRCEFRVKTSEVSREHASFTRRSDGIYVNDLGSVNGVLVNNTRVSEFRLVDGDLIQLGHIKLRLFDATETGGRTTDSAAHTPSRLAPHEHGAPVESAPPQDRSVSVHTHADYHPAIAGALAAEDGHRQRRQSVRVMFTQTWERSGRFRYGIVIVAAALLAVCAIVVGFSFVG